MRVQWEIKSNSGVREIAVGIVQAYLPATPLSRETTAVVLVTNAYRSMFDQDFVEVPLSKLSCCNRGEVAR